MDNKELIKRLVSFEDEGIEPSTGFVSTSGTTHEVFSDVHSVIETFSAFLTQYGCRYVKTMGSLRNKDGIRLVVTGDSDEWLIYDPYNPQLPPRHYELQLITTGKQGNKNTKTEYEGANMDALLYDYSDNVKVLFRDLNTLAHTKKLGMYPTYFKTSFCIDNLQADHHSAYVGIVRRFQPILQKFCEIYGRNYILNESVTNLYTFDDEEGVDTSTGFVGVQEEQEHDYTKTKGYKVGMMLLKYLVDQPYEYMECSFDGLLSYDKNDLENLVEEYDWFEMSVTGPESYTNQNNAYNLVSEYISLGLRPFDNECNPRPENICNLYEQFKKVVEDYDYTDDIPGKTQYIYNEYGYISQERGAEIEDEISEEDVENCRYEIGEYLKNVLYDFEYENDEILEELGYEV